MTPFSIVILELLAMAGPLAALAAFARVYPERRLVRAALLPAAASLGLLAAPGFLLPVILADAVLAVLVLVDLARSLPR